MSKVAAVTLPVRRLKETSAFYQLLGFREHHREEGVTALRPETYLGAELFLVAGEGEIQGDAPALVLEGGWDREQLESKGVTFLEKQFKGFPQGLCVRDPDGNLVLLRNPPDYDSYSI